MQGNKFSSYKQRNYKQQSNLISGTFHTSLIRLLTILQEQKKIYKWDLAQATQRFLKNAETSLRRCESAVCISQVILAAHKAFCCSNL